MLIAVMIGCCLFLSTCGNLNSVLENASIINPEVKSEINIAREALKKETFHSGDQVGLESAPAIIVLYVFTIIGFFVLVTFPYRNKDEWENGLYQLIALGNHNFYLIETLRFASYLLLGGLFFFSVQLCFALYMYQYQLFTVSSFLSFELMLWYNVLLVVPVTLAFGILVSSVTTGYYISGKSKSLNLVKYIGVICFIALYIKLTTWINQQPSLVIPNSHLTIDIYGFSPLIYLLRWELLIFNAFIAAMFVGWSGKILENTEA